MLASLKRAQNADVLIVCLLVKGKRGGGELEGGGGEGYGCQKSEGPLLPCLDAALPAQWEEKKKEREAEEEQSCLSDCVAALCSPLLVLPLTAWDWWIELCIAHNINSVLLFLSFWISLPHHSSPSTFLSPSVFLSPPPDTTPGPSPVPLSLLY